MPPIGDESLLIAQNNLELMRQNAELRAHIALMNENASLAQMKERLEKKLRASKTVSRVVQRKTQAEQVLFQGAPGCNSMKQNYQHFSNRNRDKSDLIPGLPNFARKLDTRGDAVSTTTTEGSTMPSESDESGTEEKYVNQGQVGSESQVRARDLHSSQTNCQVPRTSLMMRNIPTEYTRANFLELIDRQGFEGLYDFVYVPFKFKTELNQGYAFINLTTAENAESFRAHFAGFTAWGMPSHMVCETIWSDTLQGIDAHVGRYRDSPIMHESVEDRFRPLLFKDGQRIPFPEPTIQVKKPRNKKQGMPPSPEADGSLIASCVIH
jgi:hypothetical protein